MVGTRLRVAMLSVLLSALGCSGNGPSNACVVGCVGGSAATAQSSTVSSFGGRTDLETTTAVTGSAPPAGAGGARSAGGTSSGTQQAGSSALTGTPATGGVHSTGSSDATAGGVSFGGASSAHTGGSVGVLAGGMSSATVGGTGGGTGGVSSAATGGMTSSTSTALAPVISGLTIEPNPNSVLSCYVSWTTDTPADSEVDFGIGEYQFRIRQEESVTSHRVLVIGMHAATKYLMKATSTSASGTGAKTAEFTTGTLPASIPVAELTMSNPGLTQPGWTLTNVTRGGTPAPPAAAVMYDEQGLPVWYFIDGSAPDTLGDIDTQLLPNGHVVVSAVSTSPAVEVDLAGNVVWQGPAQPGTASTNWSHHFEQLANGNYLALRSLTSSSQPRLTGTAIDEITPALQVVWEWNIFDHLVPETDAARDWCHGNSVTMDFANDVFYLSCRNMGRVIKAKRSGDQAVIWQLGSGGDFTFEPPESGFADLHDPEIHADGTILLYDNGGYTARPTPEYHSRVVEYAVDEQNKVATLVWEFPGQFDVAAWYKNDWYTPIWGDADRLPNGNVLITAGTREQNQQTHIFEVQRETGVIVWEIVLPLQNGAGFGSYRAERIVPPLVHKM